MLPWTFMYIIHLFVRDCHVLNFLHRILETTFRISVHVEERRDPEAKWRNTACKPRAEAEPTSQTSSPTLVLPLCTSCYKVNARGMNHLIATSHQEELEEPEILHLEERRLQRQKFLPAPAGTIDCLRQKQARTSIWKWEWFPFNIRRKCTAMSLTLDGPEFEFLLQHLLIVWPWASHLCSMKLNSHKFKACKAHLRVSVHLVQFSLYRVFKK